MSSDHSPVTAGQLVPQNRWDQLDVPELGAWTPTLRVSVVIPHYQAPDALRITLAALSKQTYPSELLQVVVADDGSNPPLELPDGLYGLDLRVEHQEDLGFGVARARNLGARVGDGDIVLFLDCDMVPEPWQVEAHARWHHVNDHALVCGFRRHVEFGDIGPDDILRAFDGGDLATLFADHEQQWPKWIDGHMLRTADLTSTHDDLFRIVAGGNMSMRKDLYWSIGGADESFTQWGAEDTEFGYRAFVAGAVLVPERQALCWHQGFGHLPDENERKSLDEQRAKIAHLIAHPGFRRARPGRSFVVPRVVVEVETEGAAPDAITMTLESLLASDLHDLHLVVSFDGVEDGERLSRDFGGDPRITVGKAAFEHVPYRMSVPAGAVFEPRTIGVLVKLLTDTEDPVGVLRLTVPDRRPGDAAATMVRSRAVGRAERVGADDVLEEAGRLFGSRWVSGLDVGLTWYAAPDVPAGEKQYDASGGSVVDQLQDLWRTFERLDASQRSSVLVMAKRIMGLPPRRRALLLRTGARVLALLNVLGRLRRIRRPADVVRMLKNLAAAVLPAPVVRAIIERKAARRGASRSSDGGGARSDGAGWG